MKKWILALTLISVSLWMAAAALTADQECPDCPKSPPATGMLDPKWREFAAPPLAPGDRPDCHRVQFGKQDCASCHMKETPIGYSQWLGSKHGINSVKCGTCHGDANNYRSRPDRVVCIGCHSAEVHNMPGQALVTNCSFCHKGHWFTVHKINQYERFAPEKAAQRFVVPGF